MKSGTVAASGEAASAIMLEQVWQAESVWERGRGLLGRAPLDWGQGFWIEPCSSVHTIGMGYPLDLAFLDAQGVIRKLVRDVRPWRMASAWHARTTLEMRSGQLDRCAWRVGDRLTWRSKA